MSGLPSGTVTFLLTDIEGSTRLLQQLGEQYPLVLEQHRVIVRAALDACGGCEVATQGDSFFAAFPRAADALAAAVAIQRAFAELPPTAAGPLRLRIALHTGQPRLSDGTYVGLDVHLAARLGAAGHGGQVLLSRPTRDLVEHDLPSGVGLRDLGEHRFKDLPRPEQVFQLLIDDLPSDFPPLRGLEQRPNNLPSQLTTFVGRHRELAEARELLARTRLLTLTGAGGTGKTRFGIRLAADLLDRFPDGAFFVGLAPVFDPNLVIPTIAQVLGVPDVRGRPPLERLKDYLRERQLLLLLDNFEQVLGAGAHLVDLLLACPPVAAIVTSRVALRVSGEQELPVPPLALPDPDRQAAEEDPVAAFGRFEAVQLFVERARAVQPAFELTPRNAAVVAEICRRLDGLPLAIELAAARVRLLPPETMLTRLAGRPVAETEPDSATSRPITPLQFLTGGARDLPVRQQTLRNTIAWSYDLLTPAEQALFRRLAVFVGGCTLEAAEAAGGAPVGDRRWALAPDEVLDGLESLIARNLLRRLDQAEEPRFTMLETIREYGLEQLGATGEFKSLRHWHAHYYLDLAERAEPLLQGPEQIAWLRRLESEHDNLRTALEWSLAESRGVHSALRLAGALAWFWAGRAHVSEGRRWLERILSRAPAPGPARLKALYGAGWLAHIQRDSSAARDSLEAALALARELDDRWAMAWTLHLLGRVAYFDGDSATATAFAKQSLAVAQEIGDRWLAAWALHLLGLAAHIAADYAAACSRYEEAVAMRRELGYQEGIAICLNLMAMVAARQRRYADAHSLEQQSLRIHRQMGASWTINTNLASSAALAAVLQQPERAARLAGASEAFGEANQLIPIPLAETLLGDALESVRQALSETAFQAAWAAGRAMSLDQAIAEALAVEPPRAAPQPHPPSQSHPAGLTSRELEVLRLIADGRTTREIADELVVSVPTVERHITHIYTKIGARGRAEATAFALRHGLR